MNPTDFRDKRIVILGLARQGLALARFMVERGAQVTISDRGTADRLMNEIAELGAMPVQLALGGHPASLLEGCDLLCLSGGVPVEIDIVQQAIAAGIPLSNDSLLTLQMLHHAATEQNSGQNSGQRPRQIVAITGSSGKTTTTTLVGQMLRAAGIRTHVGGNIGTPLIDRLDDIGADDVVVLELSSFQLELMDPALAWGDVDGIGPSILSILNLTPNHLDRHGRMAVYARAKFNGIRTLPNGATVVLNAADPVTAALLPRAQRKADAPPAEWKLEELTAAVRRRLEEKAIRTIPFDGDGSEPTGTWRQGDDLVLAGHVLCRADELRLRGDHNVANVLAAAAIAASAGATIEAIQSTALTFAGVPHRLEIVATVDDVIWINDSIATSPERAVAALRSFDPAEQTIILLAGGKDKNLPWDLFSAEAIGRVSMLIGFGDAGPMIVRAVQDYADAGRLDAPSSAVVQRLDEAVELARRSAAPNSVVLLSPGGTSFDTYRDFEARGEHFRQLVAAFTQGTNGDGRSGRHRAPAQSNRCQPGQANEEQPADRRRINSR